MKTPRPVALPAIAPEAVPVEWAWHYRTLLALHRKLQRVQQEHERAACAPLERRGVDAAEVAEEESEHEVILAELHAEHERLGEIEAALQRIRDGRYGSCVETGEPISAARLRAIPWTRFSRAAAERKERSGASA